MLSWPIIIEIIKILIFSAVLFVWVIRYKNIIVEFKQFNYPDWLRDLVGIFKISFVVMLMTSNGQLVKVGALGLTVLMAAAVMTHFKVKNCFSKMVPSLTLLALSLLVFLS